MSRWRRALPCLALAAAACSLQPVDVGSRKELISQLPADVAPAPTLPVALLVLTPGAQGPYDTAQMAYTTASHELAYFARTEWAEKPAQMLHGLLVRTLERTRRFRAVVQPPYPAAAAYLLGAYLVELRQDFTTEPATLRLVVRAELRDGATDRAIATREFEARRPMAQRSPYAGAEAANEAAARVVRDIAAFVVDNTR